MQTVITLCTVSFIAMLFLLTKYDYLKFTKIYTKLHAVGCIAAATSTCWIFAGTFKDHVGVICLLLALVSVDWLIYSILFYFIIILFL